MEQREFIVEQETAGQRIDRFLSGEDTGLSRSALQALVAEGHVQCNGKAVAKSLKLKAGDTVLLEIPDAKPIEAVPTTWESPLAVFEATLAHEQKVTSLINNLFALTTAENDYATQSMLKWFVDEQVEEEENAQNIIDNLKMIQGNGYGLYMLDKELGARTYVQASPLAAKG